MGIAWVGGCLAEPPALGDGAPAREAEALIACDPRAEVPPRVRVASWNMSAGRRSSLLAVRQVLDKIDADLVLLQEVDVGVRRTGRVDQPLALARALDMHYTFAASIEFDGGDFGLAMLSRFPLRRIERVPLDSQGGYEPRIVLDASVCVGAWPLRVVDVHADFKHDANRRNLEDLGDYLGPAPHTSTILGGDFNATPQFEGLTTLRTETETVDVMATWDPGPTRAGKRIDYLLVNPELDVAIVEAVRVETEASDHTPLWVDLALR